MRLVLLSLICAITSYADLVPVDVPHFTMRCRLVELDGQPVPDSRQTRFHLSGIAGGVQASGSAWSEPLTFDIDAITKTIRLYPNLYLKRYPLVLHLRTLPATDDFKIEARIWWQAAPNPEATTEAADEPALDIVLEEPPADVALTAHLYGDRLGVLLWRDDENTQRIATMRQYNQRYWKHLEDVPGIVPKHFPIVDRFIAGDSDRDNVRDGITQLSRAGFSALMTPPGKANRDILLSTGLRRTSGAVYSPPGHVFDHDPAIDQAAIEAWAEKLAKPFLDSGYDGEDIALYAMADEPGWYFPSRFKGIIDNPEVRQRYHDYLAAQGLSPADVGAETWDTVLPIGHTKAVDLPSRRLHYWTTRFFAWDSARHYAASTVAAEKAFGANVPLLVNWNFFAGRHWFPGTYGNNPDKDSPDAAMAAHDWFEFARMRGCTMLWTQDWFSDDRAWQWSFYASKLNSAARLSDIEFGGYVIPRTAGKRPDGIIQKILSITGHGGKAIKYFVFGPEYNFPGNCYSFRPELLPRMAEAHAMIAEAEELLWPGRRAPSPVAMLQPRSSFPWEPVDPDKPIIDATNNALERNTTGYMADLFGIYRALQHANIPVDWIDEDGLEPETLSRLEVLYITTPNLPQEAMAHLADWVRQGGTLVTTRGAITRDRYNTPCNDFWAAAGLTIQPRERILIGRDPAMPVTRIDTPAGNAPAVAVETGADPILNATLGEGAITHFTWLPGHAYTLSQSREVDGLGRGFSEPIRALLTAPVRQAGVQPPVTTMPLVEGPLLLSEAGAALTLLNWRGEDIASLPVTVHLDHEPTSIHAVKAGPLTFTWEDGRATFALPLAAVDIVMIR